MKSYRRFLLVFQVLMGLAAQKKTVAVFTGTEGGSVEIKCGYKDSYIYSNHYFCRAPCSNSDVLIETQKADIVVSKGKYTILNTVSTRSVSVTIRNLRSTDSGVYYCSAYEWGSDKLIKVQISVKKAQANLSSTPQTTSSTDTSTTSEELHNTTTAKPNCSSAHKIRTEYNSTSSQTPPTTSSDSSEFQKVPVYGGILGLLLCCVLVALVVLYRRRSNTQTTSLKPQAPENQTLDPPPDQEEFCHVYDEMMAVYSLAGPVVQENPSELYSIIKHSPPAGEDSLYSFVAPH